MNGIRCRDCRDWLRPFSEREDQRIRFICACSWETVNGLAPVSLDVFFFERALAIHSDPSAYLASSYNRALMVAATRVLDLGQEVKLDLGFPKGGTLH